MIPYRAFGTSSGAAMDHRTLHFAERLLDAARTGDQEAQFRAAADHFAELGFMWLAFGVAFADPYEIVRYRSTMPDEAMMRWSRLVASNDGVGDYVYEHCRARTEPLWQAPARCAAPTAAHEASNGIALSLALRMIFAMKCG